MNHNKSKKNGFSNKISPIVIPLIYFCLGSIWIVGTDYIALGHIPEINRLFYISLTKGIVFVIFTAFLFYSLLEKLSKKSAEVEEYLKLTEDKYRIIVESSNQGIWVVDTENITTFVNDRIIEMLGAKKEEILNHSLFDFISPEWQCEAKQKLECHKQGAKEVYDFQFSRKDGSSFWAMVAAAPLFDQNQNYIGCIAMITDITKRKTAEEELIESRDLYLTLFDSFPTLIWRSNKEGKCDYFNKNWLEFTGRTLEEELGDGWFEGVHKDDKEKCMETYMAAFAKQESFVMEYRLRRFDGDYRWIMDYGSPFYDKNGRIVGYIGSCYDVTERKEAEVRLLDYQQNLSDIINFLPDATFAVDKNGVIISWNKAVEELTGIPAAEMLGKGDYEYSLPFYHTKRPLLVDGILNREEDLAPLYPTLEKDANNLVAESYFEHLGDGGIYIWAKASPLYDSNGELVGAVESIRDITFKKNAEQRIIKLNQELEERVFERTAELARANTELKEEIAERKKTELEVKLLNEKLSSRAAELESVNSELESFSYSVSHDLRTPLRSIDGFSQIIIDDYSDNLDENATDCFRRIRNASQRMGQLIDDLFNLSKLTRVEMVKEKVYMTQIAIAVEEDLRRLYTDRDVKLSVENDMCAEGDPQLMRIVIENILGNAWKFTSQKESANIEFGTIKSDKATIYYIKDNGIGFDMTYSSKLFRAFERLHNNKEYPGTGVGLAIVDRIIKKHGGKVWAESVLGEGSTFFFTLWSN